MSDDFAKKFATELKRERSQQNMKDEKFILEERLKKELGPALWASLRVWLEDECTKINAEMRETVLVFDRCPSDEANINRVSPPAARLHLEFNSDSHRLHYEYGGGKGEYIVEIDRGEAYFRDHYRRVFSIDEIGESLLLKLKESLL